MGAGEQLDIIGWKWRYGDFCSCEVCNLLPLKKKGGGKETNAQKFTVISAVTCSAGQKGTGWIQWRFLLSPPPSLWTPKYCSQRDGGEWQKVIPPSFHLWKFTAWSDSMEKRYYKFPPKQTNLCILEVLPLKCTDFTKSIKLYLPGVTE